MSIERKVGEVVWWIDGDRVRSGPIVAIKTPQGESVAYIEFGSDFARVNIKELLSSELEALRGLVKKMRAQIASYTVNQTAEAFARSLRRSGGRSRWSVAALNEYTA